MHFLGAAGVAHARVEFKLDIGETFVVKNGIAGGGDDSRDQRICCAMAIEDWKIKIRSRDLSPYFIVCDWEKRERKLESEIKKY